MCLLFACMLLAVAQYKLVFDLMWKDRRMKQTHTASRHLKCKIFVVCEMACRLDPSCLVVTDLNFSTVSYVIQEVTSLILMHYTVVCGPGQAAHVREPISPSSVICCRPKAGDAVRPGR